MFDVSESLKQIHQLLIFITGTFITRTIVDKNEGDGKSAIHECPEAKPKRLFSWSVHGGIN
jgi:hypothetical protein